MIFKSKLFYQIIAILSLVMAFVGIIVPGIPATEFILLCAWASAKSSPRLHKFLHTNKYTGPALYNWQHGKIITRKNKILSTISMTLCAVILLLHKVHYIVIILALGGMAYACFWIWRRPEKVESQTELS